MELKIENETNYYWYNILYNASVALSQFPLNAIVFFGTARMYIFYKTYNNNKWCIFFEYTISTSKHLYINCKFNELIL